MDSRALTLGVVAGLAVAGLARKRAAGSRDALTPTDTTGLVVGETKFGTPAVVLVDLAKLEGAQDLSDLEERTDAVLGFIAMDYPKDYEEHPTSVCDDSDGGSPLQVSMAVAQKGWGPLIYDAALWVAADNATGGEAYNGFLMPDRNNVFPGAQKVWTYYATNRKADVSIRKISKGCPQHGWPDLDPILDRMYKAKMNRPAFRRMGDLYQRWADACEELEEALGMDREEIEAKLVEMGEQFFEEKV